MTRRYTVFTIATLETIKDIFSTRLALMRDRWTHNIHFDASACSFDCMIFTSRFMLSCFFCIVSCSASRFVPR